MCKVRTPLREVPPNLLNISSNKRIVDSLLCCSKMLFVNLKLCCFRLITLNGSVRFHEEKRKFNHSSVR